MTSYLMRSSDDCGPACLEAVTGQPYDQILAAWPGGWRGGDRGRLGAPNDTPYDHFALLSSLGIPWQIRTCGQILRGEAKPDKTVVLLHHPQHPWLKQHWCILRGVTPTHVDLWWGLPEQQTASPTREQFEHDYAAGWPACAYEVGIGSMRLSWRQRFVACVTGKFV